jgi:hypothetical protein
MHKVSIINVIKVNTIIMINITITIICIIHQYNKTYYEMTTMSKRLLISESVTAIRIGVHPAEEELDNTSYAWPHGSHVRQSSAKPLLC